MLPRFSIASRRRTMTPCLLMARAPADSVTLTIAGSSSGERPNASATQATASPLAQSQSPPPFYLHADETYVYFTTHDVDTLPNHVKRVKQSGGPVEVLAEEGTRLGLYQVSEEPAVVVVEAIGATTQATTQLTTLAATRTTEEEPRPERPCRLQLPPEHIKAVQAN